MVPVLILQTILLLIFSPDIYYGLTNPEKINGWYDAVLNEKLGGLTAEKAFLKLSKYGFRVVDQNLTSKGESETVIAPPYQVGLIGFFMVRIPFDYIIRVDSKGIVTGYGLKK